MQTLNVDLGDRSYPIFIGTDLLDKKELVEPYVSGVDSDPGFAGFYDNFASGNLGPPPPTSGV